MTRPASELTVGFIGAGQMATALAKGMLSDLLTPERVLAADPSEAARERFSEATGGTTTDDASQVCAESDVIILAVKPQIMPVVLNSLQAMITPEHLVVSIAAGVTIATLTEALGADRRIVRVMPNTPALVGQGASGFSLGLNATDADAEIVTALLETAGVVVQVPERLINSITGLSGSGPAFVYLMIEALSDGGVLMGLPRADATRLAAQTLLGAATMVLETGQHPGALKDAVTSPGGTTIAGLEALELAGLRGALVSAVRAATERANELGASPTS